MDNRKVRSFSAMDPTDKQSHPRTPKRQKSAPEEAKGGLKVPSPAKPVIVTPPRGFGAIESFYFHNPAEQKKTHGQTPNGKTLLRLKKHEGKSHHYMRSEVQGQKVTVRGDDPLASPYKKQFESRVLVLLTKMQDLKNRTDTDYFMASKPDGIDSAHFQATKNKIQECIADLKSCYALKGCDKDVFLENLNENITSRKYYNPFKLLSLYQEEEYSLEKAKMLDDFITPLKASDLSNGQRSHRTLFTAETAAAASVKGPRLPSLYDDLPPPALSLIKHVF